jgi:hypothetical protein
LNLLGEALQLIQRGALVERSRFGFGHNRNA